MQAEPSPGGMRLAFLTYVQGEGSGSGRGALLVTDDATRPLEFRCTSPIKPNPLQRMLYGETLRSYIAADLVGEPLLAAVQEKPFVILVKEPLFLKLRSKIDLRMVCIRRQGEQISTVINEDNGRSRDEQSLLTCASGRFQPLTVTGPTGHAGEFEHSLAVLRYVFSDIDLMEPFDRMAKVIAELDRQEGSGAQEPKSAQSAKSQ
jgi:hypothetical protein